MKSKKKVMTKKMKDEMKAQGFSKKSISSVEQGLKEAAEGKVHDLGSFELYTKEEADYFKQWDERLTAALQEEAESQQLNEERKETQQNLDDAVIIIVSLILAFGSGIFFAFAYLV